MLIMLITLVIANQSDGSNSQKKVAISEKITIPMKHVSCGRGCQTHVPIGKPKNVSIKLKVGMICPKDQTVNYLGYKIEGQNPKVLLNKNTNLRKYILIKRVSPLNTAKLVKKCQRALGGNWYTQGKHKLRSKSVSKSIKKDISLYGRCSGASFKKVKRTQAHFILTCYDKYH